MSQVCVVIPAYQAEGSIGPLVRDIVAQGLPVIVVDDGSLDRTSAEASRCGARVLTRALNGGKGAALREGFAAALEGDFEWILVMDADGQHLPAEIPLFLKRAAGGDIDLILGSRMECPQDMPVMRRLTNWIMSRILSLLVHQSMPDTQCGFRLISRRVVDKVQLTSDRFEIDSELVVKSAWAGFRIIWVPVSSIYRHNLSFIRPVQDTIRFVRFLMRLKREPKK